MKIARELLAARKPPFLFSPGDRNYHSVVEMVGKMAVSPRHSRSPQHLVVLLRSTSTGSQQLHLAWYCIGRLIYF